MGGDGFVIVPFSLHCLNLIEQVELSHNECQNSGRRNLQCQQVIVQVHGLSLLFLRHGIDHVENLIGNLSGADRLHISHLNHFLFQAITEQFFQLLLHIVHIRSCHLDKYL